MNGAERAEAISKTVSDWGCLKFFPNEPGAREAIMQVLDRMVSTLEQLNWLRMTMIDKVGEWHGPAELRGVFTSRFSPKDGVEGWCHAIGRFSPAVLEMKGLEEHAQITAHEHKLLPSGEPAKPPPFVECLLPVLADPVKCTAVVKWVDTHTGRIVPRAEDWREARRFMERIGYLEASHENRP